MWKQTVGDWQERRQRRHGGPIPDSPQAHLPESVNTTESFPSGFLPSDFRDRVPKSLYPASDGPETRPKPSQYTLLEQQTLSRGITSTWVVVSGVPADDILDVRDYFDAYVGRTVAHHLPLAASSHSEVYLQFASSLEATQAVHTSSYSFNVESGIAAEHLHTFADAGGIPDKSLRSLEVTVGWCRDQVFLESRERMRRQLLEGDPRSRDRANRPSVSSQKTAPHTNELSSTASPASPSLESSARVSDEVTATDGADDHDAAAHPLLPRYRGWPSGSPSTTVSCTPAAMPPSRCAAGASPQAGATGLANPFTPCSPQAWDSAGNCQQDGAYPCDDRPFSESVYSSLKRAGRKRATVLSLFFHPCSSLPSARWSVCFYVPFRFALLFLWTGWNVLVQLVSSPSIFLPQARLSNPRQRHASQGEATPAMPTQSLLPPPSPWRLRRSLRVADVVPAAASPLEYISFFFYKYIPFAPEPHEVDLVLWSWLVVHSPYPQQSLRNLKHSVMARQRPASTVVGRPQTNANLPATAADLKQWEAQALGKQYEELPVLMAWRPAWWFARYSSLSFFMALAMICYVYYY